MADRLRLPREHGFWVMLGAVAITSLVRARFTSDALVAAAITLPLTTLGAAVIGRRVRKNRTYQLLASLALPIAAIPIELAAGIGVASVLVTVVAWSGVFLASALVVRGAFERSRPKGNPAPLEGGALAIVAIGGLGFACLGLVHQAIALGVSFVVLFFLVSRHPTVKQLRTLGLGLAGAAAGAAVALGISS
jgi:hypothetical protein